MNTALYITGTDTGIGKTWVTAALLRGLRADGIDVVGMKPVASGCEQTPAGWRNDDAMALLRAAGLDDADYPLVNPFALPMPASPHLAAAQAGQVIAPAPIRAALARLGQRHAAVLVEGVGGWSVPFGHAPWSFQADLVRTLTLPVLLVVGLRLGCINHALLSARAIAADGCQLIGWVGNAMEPDWSGRDAVIADLADLLPAPLLGCIGHGGSADADLLAAVAGYLRQ